MRKICPSGFLDARVVFTAICWIPSFPLATLAASDAINSAETLSFGFQDAALFSTALL